MEDTEAPTMPSHSDKEPYTQRQDCNTDKPQITEYEKGLQGTCKEAVKHIAEVCEENPKEIMNGDVSNENSSSSTTLMTDKENATENQSEDQETPNKEKNKRSTEFNAEEEKDSEDKIDGETQAANNGLSNSPGDSEGGEESDSYSSSSIDSHASRMLTDSASEFQDVIRTIQHYRRRRKRRTASESSSADSNCSCPSCDSNIDPIYFGSREGPHGGENTRCRRFCLFLDSVKFMYALFVWGTFLVAGMFCASALWVLYIDDQDIERVQDYADAMFTWTIPTLVLILGFFLFWRISWHVLIFKGYGEGDQVVCRRGMIKFAQQKELIYSIRGAIYFGKKVNRLGECRPEDYGIIGYDNEYDSEGYFNSDLEEDGQYKKDLKPYRECEDTYEREKRNIYTTNAWFRDVPVMWWELWNHPVRDF